MKFYKQDDSMGGSSKRQYFMESNIPWRLVKSILFPNI